jgi:hypothetical protein
MRMREGEWDFEKLHAEYKALKEAGDVLLDALQQRGEAATASARAGNRRPFGSVGPASSSPSGPSLSVLWQRLEQAPAVAEPSDGLIRCRFLRSPASGSESISQH